MSSDVMSRIVAVTASQPHMSHKDKGKVTALFLTVSSARSILSDSCMKHDIKKTDWNLGSRWLSEIHLRFLRFSA